MKGVSYTYFTTENAKSARELVVILREATAHVPPQLEEMAMFGGSGGARSMSYFFITCVIIHRSIQGRYGGGNRGRGGGGSHRANGTVGGRGYGQDDGYAGRDRW